VNELTDNSAGVGGGRVTDAADDEASVGIREISETRQRDDPRKTIRECGIE